MLEGVLLSTTNLKKYFSLEQGWLKRSKGVVKAVDGVSLEIYKGEILGLVGESGSGKTTLGKLILKLIDADNGGVFFEGNDLSLTLKQNRLGVTKKMQIIFQDPYNSLDPRTKIKDIILEGLYLRKINRVSREKKLKELLDMVGLPYNTKDRFPHQFSGGQRQRIAIARALAVEPEFIVLDEPVSNLDVSIQAQILNLFLELHNRLNLTYLFISHDLRVVRWLSDRIAVMQNGKIVEIAEAEQLFKSAKHPYTQQLISCSKTND